VCRLTGLLFDLDGGLAARRGAGGLRDAADPQRGALLQRFGGMLLGELSQDLSRGAHHRLRGGESSGGHLHPA